MGTNCYRKGYESGPWYELKSIRSVLDNKMAKGIDTGRERELYESWLKFPEYQSADNENVAKGFYRPLSLSGNGQGNISKRAGDITPAGNLTPASFGSLGIMQHRGRPPKAPDEPVNRVTAWRRQQKEKQSAML